MGAPDPADEGHRLAALRELQLLDSRASPQWDQIVELARVLTGRPITLVSLIDADRQWFKARRGLEAQETPRELAFCGWAILGDEPFEVENALEDARFQDNDLVTGHPNIRSYTGVPIKAPDGSPIGTVCAIDQQPGRLTPAQMQGMQILGKMAESLAHQRLVRNRLQDVLMASPDAKDTINRVAHELNTPLTPILLELRTMESKGCAPESIERIQRNIERLRGVIADAIQALDQEHDLLDPKE